jgi:hypothetical protein
VRRAGQRLQCRRLRVPLPQQDLAEIPGIDVCLLRADTLERVSCVTTSSNGSFAFKRRRPGDVLRKPRAAGGAGSNKEYSCLSPDGEQRDAVRGLRGVWRVRGDAVADAGAGRQRARRCRARPTPPS